ncbi:bifunctional oligoribonuclease/PAP phosphatase NrnA [Candidatus Uhrbacteria bacterium]|nr:bifunctional oligoribonuclease/PAP phosphatase NrnA [Candidatus Uhrbacteria bacterium]
MNGLPFKEVFDAVAKSQRILVVGDGKPDGDSLGSSSAFYMWLKREGKDTALFCVAPIPKNFLFLDGINDQTNDPLIFDQPWDMVITFDTGSLKHCGILDMLPRIPTKPIIVDVDHHATNELFGSMNLVDTKASSTCEMVYRFFEANNVLLDHRMATSLLTGLCTDTGHFSNSATNPKAMEAASTCFASGARHMDILKNLVRNKSVDSLKIWGKALERLRHVPEYDMAITWFKAEDLEGPGSDEAVEGISNFLSSACSGADTMLVLREKSDGLVKGSIRSMNRDISRLAQQLGGGGHKRASGFAIKGKIAVTDGIPRIVPN